MTIRFPQAPNSDYFGCTSQLLSFHFLHTNINIYKQTATLSEINFQEIAKQIIVGECNLILSIDAFCRRIVWAFCPRAPDKTINLLDRTL